MQSRHRSLGIAVAMAAVLGGLGIRAFRGEGPIDAGRQPRPGAAEPRAAEFPPADAGPAILGVVVDGEGRPIGGAEVAAAREGERLPARCATGPDGRFRLPVPPGAPDLLVGARATGFAPALRGGVRPGPEEIRIVLHPGARLAGLVRDSSGTPCAGARVRAALRFPGVGKDLGGFETRADEEGRFAFEGLSAVEGSLEASFHGAGSGPVEFAVPAGDRLVRRDLVVPVGPSIEGIVRSSGGEGLPGITVAARAAGGRAGVFARTGPDGRFALRGLEPVPCTVRATDYEGRWLEARLEGLTPPCREVEVTMRPDPDAPGAYRFRVEAPGGSPPRAIRILEYRAEGGPPCGSSMAEPDGEGRVPPRRLRAGRYRIALRSTAGTAASGEFLVEPGSTADLGTLRLASPAAVRGRLLDPSGAPAPEARIFAGDDSLPEPGAAAPDGSFAVPSLPAGPGLLRAVLGGCEPLLLPWRAAGGETADLGEVRFRAATGAVRGSVRSRSGTKVAGARIRLSPWEDSGPGSDGRRIEAGPDGRFEATALAAGRWGISVAPPGAREEESFVTEERSRRIDLAEGAQEEVVLEID